ncbi:hypothetical protein BJ912DRAFT_1070634 [Pholiota molesta]|nr:hypothetical protein BJ912DRAFT_1070634 [Pholiota molesta]
MPSAWPLSIIHDPSRRTEILFDTTCFSTAELDYFVDRSTDSDADSNVDSHRPIFYLADPANMPKKAAVDPHAQEEIYSRMALCNNALDTRARYTHPTFPIPSFLTTFLQPERFPAYIATKFPPLTLSDESDGPVPLSTTTQEPLRKQIGYDPRCFLTRSFLCRSTSIASTTSLNVGTSRCRSSPTTPDNVTEKAVQDWLNHLAHTLGVKHQLIQSEQHEEPISTREDRFPTHEEPVFIHEEEEEVEGDRSDSSELSSLNTEEGVLDNGVNHGGLVVPSAQERSFSIATYLKGPSGAYRFRKPDIILVNRNLRHFLQKAQLRPRWHHIDAIVEVSSSAPRRTIPSLCNWSCFPGQCPAVWSFVSWLIDRSGVCSTPFMDCTSYPAVSLARIVFALSYAKPELLGVDTTMAIDLLSGNVTKVKVQDREFDVTRMGQYHILKDAWLLVDHGISEITVLSDINSVLEADSSDDAKAYRSMHARFIVGEELGDSTDARRGKLTPKPPSRVHRRVVTGPVGDPLTSFRSREEFIKVLLDCVKLIYRAPGPNPVVLKKGARVTRNIASNLGTSSIMPAPLAGLEENIPVVGTIIDYDYARRTNTLWTKHRYGTLPFMPVAALDPKNTGNYTHGPAQDLESLFHVALGVMTFTNGPCGAPRQPTDHVPIARWYNEIDREQLFKDKTFDLMFFDTEVANHITDYWKPLAPYLREESHQACKDILEEALNASKALNEAPAKYAPATPAPATGGHPAA